MAYNTHPLKYIFKILLQQDKKFKLYLVFAIFFSLLAIVVNSVTPLLFKDVVSYGTHISDREWLFIIILMSYCIMWTLSQCLFPLRQIGISIIVERALRILSRDFMAHLYQLPMSFLAQQKTGDIASILEQATTALPTLFYGLFFFIVPVTIEMVVATMLFFKFYGLGYALLLTIFFTVFIAFSLFASKSRTEMRKKRNDSHAQVASYVTDGLFNVEVINYFGSQQREILYYDSLLARRESSQNASNRSFELLYLGHSIIIGIGFIVFSILVGSGIMNGSKSIGDLVLIHGFLLQFFMPLGAFGMIIRDTHRSLADMDRLFLIINQTLQEKERLPVTVISARKDIPVISFNNVSFSYENSKPILQNVSFEVFSGTCVGFIGATGAGKSTIIKLLFRFYDILDGEILIYGQSIKNISRQQLTSLFGIVPQDPFLFNNTVAYNITYGKPDASMAEIIRASQYAQIHATIDRLPDQYETLVGQQGNNFSRGERQRIALARALIKNPSIYIFDEATASLDDATKTRVYHNLYNICKAKTRLIITHDPSNLIGIDQWLSLENGSIINVKNVNIMTENKIYEI